jgi:hypothetical protein
MALLPSAAAFLCCIIASASATPRVGSSGSGSPPRWHELTPDYSYAKYCAQFDKPAASSSSRREAVFAANLARILAHNAEPQHTWKMGVNQFTDMTDTEFRSRLASPAALSFAR